MGILSRFNDIIKANINDLLDKAEDPAKMIEQYLRDLTDSLAEVKESTASVMAEETRAKRLLDQNKEEVSKYDELARRALKAGNEGDARIFLAKKLELENTGQSLQQTYNVAHENATKMRQMHDKLVSDIETLYARKESIKAKVAVAKTQKKVNEISNSADRAANAMGAFDRMEAKAEKMLDEADAMFELNQTSPDTAEELEKQYRSKGNSESVDAELTKLKLEMGL